MGFKRVLIFFIIMPFLLAFQYDSTLFTIHSKVVPKIIFMDENAEKKLVKSQAVIVVVYDKKDEVNAKLFQNMLTSEIEKSSKSSTVVVRLKEYSEISTATNASMFYFLKTSSDVLVNAVLAASKKNIMTFGYDIDDMQYGVIVAISLERKTTPVVNLKAARENDIFFKDAFLRISKIYNKESK